MEKRVNALELHRRAKGKIRIYPSVNIQNEEDLGNVYVPGSAQAAIEIAESQSLVFDYTGRGNRVAVISDGSAVLGLGNVGPHAALPVMEGKCLLFKLFGDVNAIPICIDAQSTDEIISCARMIAPTMGGINIEDVSSPNTFEVIKALRGMLDIPVMCDDQHGSAVSTVAALTNALILAEKNIADVKIVIVGAGAAGIAVARMLAQHGARNIVCLNSSGILHASNPRMDYVQEEFASKTNPEGLKGGLDDAIGGADVLIGLSKGGIITGEHVKKMNKHAIVFAMALPDPEISYEEAKAAGAEIIATAAGDAPNTIRNLHAYPGIMRGALDVQARMLTDSMLMCATAELAKVVDRRRLSPDRFVPESFCDEATPRVAEAVAQCAIREGLATIVVPQGFVYENTWQRLYSREASHI